MIGIVTTLATATCANCGGEIRQGKSDLSTVAEWTHEFTGTQYCPESPMASPIETTIVPAENDIEVVECKPWEVKQNGTSTDWVARCPRCSREVAREWGAHPQPTYTPVHLHRKEPEK